MLSKYAILWVIGQVIILQAACLMIEDTPHILKLAVMGTNDLHGTAFPKSLIRNDNREQYKYGGLVYMARLLNIIKEEYGENAIYLDTGDQYQGGIEAGPQASKGEIIADFFNALDLKASALGNHEFDYGHSFLINYLNFKNSTSLSANLFSEDGEPNFLPKHKSSQIFVLSGVKLGIIGLATTETPTTTSGFISHKFPAYQFHEYPAITIREAESLRSAGAEIILVLAHFGNKCPWNKTYDIRSNLTEQQPCETDEVITFIDNLPEGTIDGILCGHRHEFAHHWYKNIPFMGAIDGGYYFNVMYFYFDTLSKKVIHTEIEGPIPVCEKIFSNSKTCDFHTYQELQTAGPLTTWVFHGKEVYADEKISNIFEQKYVPQMEKFTRKLVLNELFLNRVQTKQNPLANLITSLMIRAAKEKGYDVDFSVINHGAFRSAWYPGMIQDQHFFNMFPFENYLTYFQILGSDLKQMIKRIQNGWDGFYFFDGIFQTVSLQKITNPEDEDDFYFQKGFVNATLLNGNQIQLNKVYKGVTVEFLLHGGDDFVKAFGQYIDPSTGKDFQKLPILKTITIGEQRELLHKELMKLEIIRESEWSIGKQRSRMVVI